VFVWNNNDYSFNFSLDKNKYAIFYQNYPKLLKLIVISFIWLLLRIIINLEFNFNDF